MSPSTASADRSIEGMRAEGMPPDHLPADPTPLDGLPPGGVPAGGDPAGGAPPPSRLHALWTLLVQTARLVVGVPDYDRYVAHMRRLHPGTAPMDREAFFADRLRARYGRGASRCC